VFEKFRSDPVPCPTRPKWSKPPEGFAKLNCDGAFRAHDLSGGWGFVIRDSVKELSLAQDMVNYRRS